MRLEHADLSVAKGWYLGPWNSALPVGVGYANIGVDEPHEHQALNEVYLVARGTAEIRIEQETIKLKAGDVIVVEPGEAHTFVASSPDYFHFVVHVLAQGGEITSRDKRVVSRTRLGL
jgi:mannose-6-phosphate isomerase-like protein (cupin superfamily)